MKTILNLIFAGLFISLGFNSCQNNKIKSNQIKDSLLAVNSSDSSILQYAQGIEKIKNSYQLTESPIYSMGDYSFYIQAYKNDSIPVAYKEFGDSGEYGFKNISYYLEKGDLVFYDEISKNLNDDGTDNKYQFVQTRIYYRNSVFLKAEQRIAKTEKELALQPFLMIDKNLLEAISEFDIDKYENALHQTENFDLSFDNILTYSPKIKYLITSKLSGYEASYRIQSPDSLIIKLEENPEAFKGKKLDIKFNRKGNEMSYISGVLK